MTAVGEGRVRYPTRFRHPLAPCWVTCQSTAQSFREPAVRMMPCSIPPRKECKEDRQLSVNRAEGLENAAKRRPKTSTSSTFPFPAWLLSGAKDDQQPLTPIDPAFAPAHAPTRRQDRRSNTE